MTPKTPNAPISRASHSPANHSPARPSPAAAPGHAHRPMDPLRPAAPVEPAEVLGRHKNAGQKDHKGAR